MKLFRLLQFLSIDIGLAAVASATFASQALNLEPPAVYYLVLFLIVLGIYNADHAWDAGRIEDRSDSRRAFHFRWRRTIAVLSGICIFSGALLALLLPKEVVIGGLLVGLLMCVYFLMLRAGRLTRLKELFVTIGFTSGIWVPLLLSGNPDFRIGVLIVLFFIACALNLLSLALCDLHIDRLHGETNLALVTSESFVRLVIGILCIVGALAGLAIVLTRPDWFITVSLIQVLIQVGLSFWTSNRHEAIRLIGDWAFLLYAIPWVIQKLDSLHLIS
ncbi:MAG: hypothetical protein JNM27_10605 [Leptospirales bacterium]|nr:hypothetical protein [Leptospirales bacterium]